MIRIESEKCTHCGTCVQHCPAGIIVEGPELDEKIHKYCVSCGHCAVVCPSEAISVLGVEDLNVPPYQNHIPISLEALKVLLQRRRSIRKYKPEPVSKAHLEQIIEAASLVPTAHNWRAFKAYVCRDQHVIGQIHQRLTEHYSRLIDVFKQPIEGIADAIREEIRFGFERLVVNPVAGRDSLFWNTNTLLVFTTTINHPLCFGDAWIASFAAVMSAETIPVGTCYNGFLIMGLNEDPSIKALMKIPSAESVVTGFTMGYSDETHYRYPPRKTMPTTWIEGGAANA
jgi:nitroreductase/NAD-dependent dihydropyrimidine dehydrogenase PreA subunit